MFSPGTVLGRSACPWTRVALDVARDILRLAAFNLAQNPPQLSLVVASTVIGIFSGLQITGDARQPVRVFERRGPRQGG